MPKYLNKVSVSQKVEEVVEVPQTRLGGLPFIGSDLFILTSMVMSSIMMEVIHMYLSIAIKPSKYLTGLLCTLYQQLIKANVNSFMCDALLMKVT